MRGRLRALRLCRAAAIASGTDERLDEDIDRAATGEPTSHACSSLMP
jgi:hypothetical protein